VQCDRYIKKMKTINSHIFTVETTTNKHCQKKKTKPFP